YDFNTIENEESKEVNSDNMNHLMSWDIETQLDARNYLKISPNVSFNSSRTLYQSTNIIENKNIISGRTYSASERTYSADENLSSPNFDVDLLYSRAFKKAGRKFVLNMQGKYATYDKLEKIGSVDINTGLPNGVGPYILD